MAEHKLVDGIQIPLSAEEIAQRQTWESHWQEVSDYKMPRKADVTKRRSPGDKRSELMRLSSQGGGVGIGLSRIRGRGKAIRDNGVSEGVVPWAKIYDSTILANGISLL